MTSDHDDLEDALRQSLKLRRELAAKVAKAKGGGSAYRWVGFFIGSVSGLLDCGGYVASSA
jgi:hypothetical protein